MIYNDIYCNTLDIRHVIILNCVLFFDLFLNILHIFLPGGHMVTRVTVTIFRLKLLVV